MIDITQFLVSHFMLLAPMAFIIMLLFGSLNLKDIHRKFLGLFVLLPENMTDEQKVRFGIDVDIDTNPKPKKVYLDKHCKPCGAPLVLGKAKCEYCGTTHNEKSPQEEYLLNKMKTAHSHSMFVEAALYGQQAKYQREYDRLFLNKVKSNLFDEN